MLWDQSIGENNSISSVQFSLSVMSDSLWPHGLPHTRPPCPSSTPRAYSTSCPLSQWCHPTISPSVILFSSYLQFFPASRVFSNESILCIRWPKYWSFIFSISPSNEWRTDLLQDWLVGSRCSPRDSQESSPAPQFKSINSSVLMLNANSSQH